MKIGYSALGIVATGALVLAGVGPANAAEDATLDDIRTAVETRAVLPDTTTTAESIDLSDGLISAPGSDGSDVQLRLPGAPRAAAQSDELALNVTGGTGYTTAIQDTGDGTFRALMHIDSAAAPREYRFELGEGVELIPLEDGGVTARDAAGDILGTFEPAWARDANGSAVPTSYRIDGSALVQSVTLTSATAFPVVADPFWIPALLVVARFTAHAASQAAARGVSQAVIKQVVQNGVRSAGNKGTSVFTQGSGKNRIRVIVDNKSGNIITVTKG
ncbi:hypothetical protein BFL36_12770 [Clavibacter michiganensis]|uniref:DUF4258 domain-containing protein n=1 Tax=Clavibacter michiganensis TaxID=28447 RepID=A0A251Y4F9_9MICO|nr:DUF4258 domain-containing protein [Clavibacter michiganensis]OUE18908.1 hypothetical protein BFL36_12770 [Clavibacter michiganensis]